jgi:hypothetical protein
VISGGGGTIMPRRFSVLAALCLLAVSGSLCFVATQSAVAKNKPSVVAKHKSSVAVKKQKHKSVAAKRNKKNSYTAKKQNSSAAANEGPVPIPQPRTPVDKQDCIAAAQAFYVRAQTLARRTKQTIPQDFVSVISKLDELCGEEEFEKARISINWMNMCLENFTRDQKARFCSRNEGYF